MCNKIGIMLISKPLYILLNKLLYIYKWWLLLYIFGFFFFFVPFVIKYSLNIAIIDNNYQLLKHIISLFAMYLYGNMLFLKQAVCEFL